MELFAAVRTGDDALVRELHITFVGLYDTSWIFVYEKLEFTVSVMDDELSLICSIE